MNFPSSVRGDTTDLLRRDVTLAFQRVTSVGEARLMKDVAISTAATTVAHGLSATPRACFVMGQVDARVWRSAVPDTRNVYLIASVAVTCDILIIP